jgi:hypothetical protein
MRFVLIADRKWPYVWTASWSAYWPPLGWVFVATTQWRNFCANDALFVCLMHDPTPKGTIDELYSDGRKKMAVCVDSIMVGPLWSPQGWVFVAPSQWQNSCANDALFVCLMRDPTPKGTIDEVFIDSWKKMAICVDSIMVGLLRPFQRWVLVAPLAMTKFLCIWCSFHFSHAWSYSRSYYGWGLYDSQRKWPYMWTASWSAWHSQWQVFVASMQWRNSCANDALFIQLMHIPTVIY